jgi:hypothetical protein
VWTRTGQRSRERWLRRATVVPGPALGGAMRCERRATAGGWPVVVVMGGQRRQAAATCGTGV